MIALIASLGGLALLLSTVYGLWQRSRAKRYAQKVKALKKRRQKLIADNHELRENHARTLRGWAEERAVLQERLQSCRDKLHDDPKEAAKELDAWIIGD